jgi:hypothetical protein
MRCQCPHCSQRVEQDENLTGPYFCSSCRKLFFFSIPKMPPWILGVVVVLVGCRLIGH